MNSDPQMKLRNQRKLLMNTQRQGSTDCLVWQGQISNGGYGRLMLKTDDGNKMVSASRAAYQLFIGPVCKDKIVLQKCRNRLCVNPEHLELVDKVPLDYWHRS
jgi:hypothetical protein